MPTPADRAVSSAGAVSRGTLGKVWRSPAYSIVLSALQLGCNVVRGFEDTSNTLFPEQHTHLQAPGLRIATGGYRDLRMVSGREHYLLARAPNDRESHLYSLPFAAPEPCGIPRVARYVPSYGPAREPPLIAYFEEDVERGLLRFADARCAVHDMVVADAGLPIDETARGFVVRAGDQLLLVDVESWQKELLSTHVSEVMDDLFGLRHLAVLDDRRFRLFSFDWQEQGVFGDEVVSLKRARGGLLFEDAGGIHRLTASGRLGPNLVTMLAEGGCRLGTQDGVWFTYSSACTQGRPTAFHEPTSRQWELPLDADPRYLKLVPAAGSQGLDPGRDRFWYFFLLEVDPETELGRLMVRTPDGVELELGSHAALDRLDVVERAGDVYGHALVDIEGEKGRYLRWTPSGERQELARAVPRAGQSLLVDFDGTVGRLAVPTQAGLSIVAEGVPAVGALYPDPQQRWTVLLHDLHGSNGSLSVLAGQFGVTPLDRVTELTAAPRLQAISSDARYLRTGLLTSVLPGVIYLEDYDASSGTGRLDYRNLELRFTSTISQGVADFLIAPDQVIYSVPFGDDAGIWFAAAK